MPAGRAGAPGDWLAVREAAAMDPPVPARRGAVWDGRFRQDGDLAGGMTLGALGAQASRLRRLRPGWPAALLATLPALREGERLVAVPALCYREHQSCIHLAVSFVPALPLAGAAFRRM
jgi:tRNA(Ile)-lysidine synthase